MLPPSWDLACPVYIIATLVTSNADQSSNPPKAAYLGVSDLSQRDGRLLLFSFFCNGANLSRKTTFS